MIKAFQILLSEKRNEVMTLKDKYANGYSTLIETESKVNEMKAELIALQPELIETAKKVAEQTIIVTEKTEAAEAVKTEVAKEESTAQAAADEANAIKTDCETELAKALPALAAAEKALNAIDKGDIAEMKMNNKPHPGVICVMTAVAVLFDLKPERKMNAETQKKEDIWWPTIQKLLQDISFL